MQIKLYIMYGIESMLLVINGFFPLHFPTFCSKFNLCDILSGLVGSITIFSLSRKKSGNEKKKSHTHTFVWHLLRFSGNYWISKPKIAQEINKFYFVLIHGNVHSNVRRAEKHPKQPNDIVWCFVFGYFFFSCFVFDFVFFTGHGQSHSHSMFFSSKWMKPN